MYQEVFSRLIPGYVTRLKHVFPYEEIVTSFKNLKYKIMKYTYLKWLFQLGRRGVVKRRDSSVRSDALKVVRPFYL